MFEESSAKANINVKKVKFDFTRNYFITKLQVVVCGPNEITYRDARIEFIVFLENLYVHFFLNNIISTPFFKKL